METVRRGRAKVTVFLEGLEDVSKSWRRVEEAGFKIAVGVSTDARRRVVRDEEWKSNLSIFWRDLFGLINLDRYSNELRC